MSDRDNKHTVHEKHIHVSCAIIERDGLVLAAQRNAGMSMPHKWEFPGGKIRPDEKPEECLYREIDEELGLQIVTTKSLEPATHHYPTFTITLYPFICSIISGKMKLNEHAAITWLPPGELNTLDWAKADLPVLATYYRQLEKWRLQS